MRKYGLEFTSLQELLTKKYIYFIAAYIKRKAFAYKNTISPLWTVTTNYNI